MKGKMLFLVLFLFLAGCQTGGEVDVEANSTIYLGSGQTLVISAEGTDYIHNAIHIICLGSTFVLCSLRYPTIQAKTNANAIYLTTLWPVAPKESPSNRVQTPNKP